MFGIDPSLFVVGFVVVGFLTSVLKIVPEYERLVVLRFGKSIGVKGPGWIILIPVVDKGFRINMRVQTLDVPPQDIITVDNISLKVNAVVYIRPIDPEKAFLNIQDYLYATSQCAQTSLRDICGQMSLEQILQERDLINKKIQTIIDQTSEPWGVKISDVAIKNVEIPQEMKRAMAIQAEAERERRAKVISAEGEYEAATKLSAAAKIMSENESSMQLRYLQTMREMSTEGGKTLIFPFPMEFLNLFKNLKS